MFFTYKLNFLYFNFNSYLESLRLTASPTKAIKPNPATSVLEEFIPVFGNILDFLSSQTLEVSCDIVFVASACVVLFFLEADDWAAITNVLK